jgi:hypothetical protein
MRTRLSASSPFNPQNRSCVALMACRSLRGFRDAWSALNLRVGTLSGAKALRLDVPPSLLTFADVVIEADRPTHLSQH